MKTFVVNNKTYPGEKHHVVFKLWCVLAYHKLGTVERVAKRLDVTTSMAYDYIHGKAFTPKMHIRNKLKDILGDWMFYRATELYFDYMKEENKSSVEAFDATVKTVKYYFLATEGHYGAD